MMFGNGCASALINVCTWDTDVKRKKRIGMDALVHVRAWSTDVIKDALAKRMHLQHNRFSMVWACMLVNICSYSRT